MYLSLSPSILLAISISLPSNLTTVRTYIIYIYTYLEIDKKKKKEYKCENVGADDSDKVEPPMPPTTGRYEVVIDNDSIQRLDLSPFQTATGINSPSSGNQSINQSSPTFKNVCCMMVQE